MKNIKWMYVFIWMGFGSCVLSIVFGLIYDKDIYWEVCTIGWIGTSFFLQKKIDELESKK